ncbi:MAG TPA: class I tRNA ligase family protein [Magnetococcales bacterium]|nr:class I tRNA ligase family protein [Magnetococcales bacterium]
MAVGSKVAARATMLGVLEESLRLLHPLMPFITEELWLRVAPLAGRSGESIMLAAWPVEDPLAAHEELVEKEMDWVISLVTTVRTLRAELDLPPGKPLRMMVMGGDEAVGRLERQGRIISVLARIESWSRVGEAPGDDHAVGVLEDLRLFIPLSGLLDVEAEVLRLRKGLEKLEKELGTVEKKLTNPSFIERAKPEVVEKERAKEAELKEKQFGLKEALRRLEKMGKAS